MMRAAGLDDAIAAMTMAGSRIEDIPADQFNHCVVALGADAGRLRHVDPTWVPYNNDIWSKLETEQHYLVGHARGRQTLSRIRYSPPEESPLSARHGATLGEDGTLAGTLRLEAGGASDGRLRGSSTAPQRDAGADGRRPAGRAQPRGAGRRGRPPRAGRLQRRHVARRSVRGPALRAPGRRRPRVLPAAVNVVKDHGTLFRAGATAWEEERLTDILLYTSAARTRKKLPSSFAATSGRTAATSAALIGASTASSQTMRPYSWMK